MRLTNLISILIFIIFITNGCCKQNKSNINVSKISNFYGEWEVIKTEKFGGTLIKDEEFNLFIKYSVIIKKNYIKYFDLDGESNVIYKYQKINNQFEEGVIQNKSTSAFYGFYTERKFINQYQVIDKNNELFCTFEVLDNDNLLFMESGRIIIMERKK